MAPRRSRTNRRLVMITCLQTLEPLTQCHAVVLPPGPTNENGFYFCGLFCACVLTSLVFAAEIAIQLPTYGFYLVPYPLLKFGFAAGLRD